MKRLSRDLEEFAWPFFDRTSTLEGVEDAYHGAGFTKRPAYLQFGLSDVPVFPFVGVALARHAGRKDLAKVIAYYRKWLGEYGPSAGRKRNVKRFDAFAKAR